VTDTKAESRRNVLFDAGASPGLARCLGGRRTGPGRPSPEDEPLVAVVEPNKVRGAVVAWTRSTAAVWSAERPLLAWGLPTICLSLRMWRRHRTTPYLGGVEHVRDHPLVSGIVLLGGAHPGDVGDEEVEP
jgi:hypothetical protein